MKFSMKKLIIEDISEEFLNDFNRYQEVTKAWRKVNGEYVLKDISFIDDWNEEDKNVVIQILRKIIKEEGAVYGDFDGEKLVGFSAIEHNKFGSRSQYVNLKEMHVSKEYRGYGIGKSLMKCCIDKAKEWNIEKIYISAHSAYESQKFYKGLGCTLCEEINQELYEKEPYDCHLELSMNCKHKEIEVKYLEEKAIDKLIEFEKESKKTEPDIWIGSFKEEEYRRKFEGYNIDALKNNKIIVAEIDGKIVGRCDVLIMDSLFDFERAGYIDWIYTLKDNRGMGNKTVTTNLNKTIQICIEV